MARDGLFTLLNKQLILPHHRKLCSTFEVNISEDEEILSTSMHNKKFSGEAEFTEINGHYYQILSLN